MDYTSLHNLPGILTSLDFHKAFDSIEWPFIMKTLHHLNFGTGIKRWLNIFYTNIESAVQNNGFITSWFKPSKGVRQRCSPSPYLFILSAEVLIKVFGKEIKLSQFADDTTLSNSNRIFREGLENCLGFRKNCWSVPKCKKDEGLLVGEMEK